MEYLKPGEKKLMKACAGSNIAMVKGYLESINGTANILDEDRTSLLHIVFYYLIKQQACRNGSYTIIKELLKYKANVNLCDCAGWTPLHVAAYANRPYICYLLLINGADMSIETRDKKSAFDLIQAEEGEPIYTIFNKYFDFLLNCNERNQSKNIRSHFKAPQELLNALETNEIVREKQMASEFRKSCAKEREYNSVASARNNVHAGEQISKKPQVSILEKNPQSDKQTTIQKNND